MDVAGEETVMVLVRDETGRFFEVEVSILEGHEVEAPLHHHDASFPASAYRWDPRENPAECTDEGAARQATDVVHYHWGE
jgi:hypothetical protein